MKVFEFLRVICILWRKVFVRYMHDRYFLPDYSLTFNFLFSQYYYFIEVQLAYNIALVSGIQHNDFDAKIVQV